MDNFKISPLILKKEPQMNADKRRYAEGIKVHFDLRNDISYESDGGSV